MAKHIDSAKRGSPPANPTHNWFGMKITAEDKLKIKRLAAIEGKPASRVIMELVTRALDGHNGLLSTREILQLPEQERHRVLEAQAKKAEKLYRSSLN